MRKLKKKREEEEKPTHWICIYIRMDANDYENGFNLYYDEENEIENKKKKWNKICARQT